MKGSKDAVFRKIQYNHEPSTPRLQDATADANVGSCSAVCPLRRPITDYAMVIQCGGCMITGKQLKNRLQPAIDAGIPVSNYGMTIAYLHGIFERATKELNNFKLCHLL